MYDVYVNSDKKWTSPHILKCKVEGKLQYLNYNIMLNHILEVGIFRLPKDQSACSGLAR